jgi:hypothetical protein
MLLPVFVSVKPQHGTVTVSKVTNVYNDYTFRVNINSLSPIVEKNILIRVNGMDAPEVSVKFPYEKDLAYKTKELVTDELLTTRVPAEGIFTPGLQ